MRILIYSPAFLPRIGGLELNTANLAEGLAKLGQDVAVVTTTAAGCPGDGPSDSYRVVRNPSPAGLLRWTRWCEVYLQQNVSLRGLWPLLLVRRPWVASHHSWYCRADGRVAWQDRLKRFLLRFAAGSIAVSQAVAADLSTPSVVIPNAYRDAHFRILSGIQRTRDLAFVGRLVSDKGGDVLLEALRVLAERGMHPGLTVVGEGPERPAMEAQAARLGVAEQVEFLGSRTGDELVRILNRHRILVVPSRYNEPFGIVALEGIACGCLVVGSQGGGLAEAIGPCGFTFRNGDATGLAAVLEELLRDPGAARRTLDSHVAEHLSRFSSASYARAYLRVLAAAAGRRSVEERAA